MRIQIVGTNLQLNVVTGDCEIERQILKLDAVDFNSRQGSFSGGRRLVAPESELLIILRYHTDPPW